MVDNPDNVTLERRLEQLEDEVKRREFSLISALATLVEDWQSYKKGESEFPKSAIVGVIVAYLRPRIVIVVASLVAALFGGMQLFVLVKQNTLIDQQNRLITAQTESNVIQSTHLILSSLPDGIDERTAMGMLSSHSTVGFDVLHDIAVWRTKNAGAAIQALTDSRPKHTQLQVSRMFSLLLFRIYNGGAGIHAYDKDTSDSFTNSVGDFVSYVAESYRCCGPALRPSPEYMNKIRNAIIRTLLEFAAMRSREPSFADQEELDKLIELKGKSQLADRGVRLDWLLRFKRQHDATINGINEDIDRVVDILSLSCGYSGPITPRILSSFIDVEKYLEHRELFFTDVDGPDRVCPDLLMFRYPEEMQELVSPTM